MEAIEERSESAFISSLENCCKVNSFFQSPFPLHPTLGLLSLRVEMIDVVATGAAELLLCLLEEF